VPRFRNQPFQLSNLRRQFSRHPAARAAGKRGNVLQRLLDFDSETKLRLQFRFPGGGKIELLEPLGDGFLTEFLERYGEGLHHITFKTDDIGEAISELEGKGYELVDVNLDSPHWKEAFLRPSKAHGTLIQIAQSAFTDEQASEHMHPSNIEELLG